MMVEEAHLRVCIAAVLVRAGAGQHQAEIVARSVAGCQRDGSHSHGLQRLPGFVSSLEGGWLNGRCEPSVSTLSPTVLRVDGQNGFSQVALDGVSRALAAAARESGIAMATLHNIHHFGALWPDVEPFARDGFVALTVVSSRSQILAWDGKRRVFGTNPIAFATPVGDDDPMVFDMASSVMSQGDVLHARTAGKRLPDGVGVDVDGLPTNDPDAVLAGGALVPFGGPKGSAIAFMVEVLAAALSGAELGFEHSPAARSAPTSRSGQFVLLIDPSRAIGDGFAKRIADLVTYIHHAGATRLPSARRYERRRLATQKGIELDSAQAEMLGLAGQSDTAC